ncbi:hypothetical protein Tco_0803686 [Tanacetum coccineum]|uniref:Uncharacterized protein n=1 Tax=Tanacetum coccineum TaxID=301880 RepID=A0ABQ5A351_9ASTR
MVRSPGLPRVRIINLVPRGPLRWSVGGATVVRWCFVGGATVVAMRQMVLPMVHTGGPSLTAGGSGDGAGDSGCGSQVPRCTTQVATRGILIMSCRNQLVYEPTPGNNYDFPWFDQPPEYPIDQSLLQDLDFESHFNCLQRDTNRILEELLRTLKPNSRVGEHEGSDDYTEDALLMRDEVISTTPARENNKLIKSSIDDLVPIPKKSEVTSDSILVCDRPLIHLATRYQSVTPPNLGSSEMLNIQGRYFIDQ